MQDVVVASGNPHKVEEVRSVLGALGWRVLSLRDVGAGDAPEPVENGTTFAENARIKALAYASLVGRLVLADDSGLVVDALGGEPGVHSARWAGVDGDRATRDAANNAKLLARLAGVPDAQRTARFVCSMCVGGRDGTVIAQSEGVFHGWIGHEARGGNGFGYDPLFRVRSTDVSGAELTPQQKNALSHRGSATRAIAHSLARLASVAR
ncbi:MAG: RdgB/HAM1 family non-canonical purine NTP pyrophosphatase [Phycisphaerae bacterium]|nr:RdgB/HAM1 family non-canonical purine NTP pyrophosphatase [Phycisphaerae bacterium]